MTQPTTTASKDGSPEPPPPLRAGRAAPGTFRGLLAGAGWLAAVLVVYLGTVRFVGPWAGWLAGVGAAVAAVGALTRSRRKAAFWGFFGAAALLFVGIVVAWVVLAL